MKTLRFVVRHPALTLIWLAARHGGRISSLMFPVVVALIFVAPRAALGVAAFAVALTSFNLGVIVGRLGLQDVARLVGD